MISFNEALDFVRSIPPLGEEKVKASKALLRVLSQPVISKTDAPSVTSSLKDGYALKSDDISTAAKDSPVPLAVKGTVTAGDDTEFEIHQGEAVRIMTGAPVPPGATAILPQELTTPSGQGVISALAPSQRGRNILERGTDLRAGHLILEKDTLVTPAISGLISASGNNWVWAYKRPIVSVLATGSELAEEGAGSLQGKIFPSNRATIVSWLQTFGIECRTALCGDDEKELEQLLLKLFDGSDAVITSGGVLDGDRDLVISIMERIGVKFLFKRCRIGPGKGVCMGVKGTKFIFNLPGGPPSNYLAFIFIALPGLLRLMGRGGLFPPMERATVLTDLKGRDDWTQLILAKSRMRGVCPLASPVKETSRLKRIALADCVIVIPEGISRIKRGQMAEIRRLCPCW